MPEELQQNCVAEADPDFQTVIGRASAGVLETMFFEEAVESPCDHGWLDTAISTEIHFDGSHCGDFLFSVSPCAARTIAAGFLGLDPEEMAVEQGGQVILELTNILCGSVLSSLWPDSDLTLGSPEPSLSTPNAGTAMHLCFTIPDGPVSVSVRLCGGAASF